MHLANNDGLIGSEISYDEYLYVENSFGDGYIEERIRYWESLGLVGETESAGFRYWRDFCRLRLGECPEINCEWLRYDAFRNNVSHPSDESNHVVLTTLGPVDTPSRYPFIEGRFSARPGIFRGAVSLGYRVFGNHEAYINISSKGCFRRGVLGVPVRQMIQVTIDDYAAHRTVGYGFRAEHSRFAVLELQSDMGSLRIDYWPTPPETGVGESARKRPRPVTVEPDSGNGVRSETTTLSVEEIDKLLREVPRPRVHGRQVAVITNTLSVNYDPIAWSYFAWPNILEVGEADGIPSMSVPFDALLVSLLRRQGYLFTESTDPYQVDWKRTLFLRVHEQERGASEITIEILILRIFYTHNRGSGQPSVEEKRLWSGTFIVDSPFYLANREYVAERMIQSLGWTGRRSNPGMVKRLS